jgi:hypothetical protein
LCHLEIVLTGVKRYQESKLFHHVASVPLPSYSGGGRSLETRPITRIENWPTAVNEFTPARCAVEDRGMNTSEAGGAPRQHDDSGSRLGAEVAVPGVEIECTDA